MRSETKVFDILLTITQNLGLQSNFWISLYRVKRFSLFLLLQGVSWLLMIAKLIFQSDEVDLEKFIVIASTSLNIIRVTYFVVEKTKILSLHKELNEVLNAAKSEIYKNAAEKRLRKVFNSLMVFLTVMILATFITYIFEDESKSAFYNPKLLNYSGLIRIVYTILLCGFACHGYVSLWACNLFVIHFLIYLHELSNFVACKFESMKTNEDLKACVELHLYFKK